MFPPRQRSRHRTPPRANCCHWGKDCANANTTGPKRPQPILPPSSATNSRHLLSSLEGTRATGILSDSFSVLLSGLRHKYDDVRCAQFGLWRGARRAHPRHGAVTDEQRSHRPNSAQPGGRQDFFVQTSLFAPHRSTAGYARRSRLVWAKNPLPRTSSYLCLRPLSHAPRRHRAFGQAVAWMLLLGSALDLRGQVVDVTATLDASTLSAGGSTVLPGFARVTPGLQANADRIFSWYVDVLNTNAATATVNFAAMQKPTSDQSPQTSSPGTPD